MAVGGGPKTASQRRRRGCTIGPWTVVAVSLLLESIGGLFYMFGVFSGTLKNESWVGGASENGTLTQGQLSLVSTAANIGGNLGLPVGLFVDRFGLVWSLVVGAFLGGSGWFLMFLMLFLTSVAWPYWPLLVAGLLQGHAQIWTDVCVITTTAKVFPVHRGLGIGLAKAFVGLSGSIATQIYTGFYKPNIVPFILFVAVEFVVICVVGAAVLSRPLHKAKAAAAARRDAPSEEEKAQAFHRVSKVFGFGYGMTILLATCAVGLAVLEQFTDISDVARMVLTGVMVGVFATMCAALVSLDCLCGGAEKYGPALGEKQEVANPCCGRKPAAAAAAAAAAAGANSSSTVTSGAVTRKTQDELREPMLLDDEDASLDGYHRGQTSQDIDEYQAVHVGEGSTTATQAAAAVAALDADKTLCQAVCSLDLYLIGFTMLIVGGSGMVIINNISQIVAAIPGTRSGDEDIFVTLISVSNCAGRLLSGFVSDLGVNRSRGRISRPWFLAGACVVMAASFLLVTLWSSLASLYIACVLIGMAYGAINALNPATASEIFGLKSFGSIYGTIGLFLAAGSFGLAHYTAGAFSDHFTNSSLSENCVPSPTNHNGWDCFGYTFIICLASCVLGTGMMSLLACRTRPMYMRKYAKVA